jgi:hypothetical protein
MQIISERPFEVPKMKLDYSFLLGGFIYYSIGYNYNLFRLKEILDLENLSMYVVFWVQFSFCGNMAGRGIFLEFLKKKKKKSLHELESRRRCTALYSIIRY